MTCKSANGDPVGMNLSTRGALYFESIVEGRVLRVVWPQIRYTENRETCERDDWQFQAPLTDPSSSADTVRASILNQSVKPNIRWKPKSRRRWS